MFFRQRQKAEGGGVVVEKFEFRRGEALLPAQEVILVAQVYAKKMRVVRVHGHHEARFHKAPYGMLADGRDGVGQPVAGGAEFKQHGPFSDEIHDRRIPNDMNAVADPLRPKDLYGEPRLLRRVRRVFLSRMQGDAQAGLFRPRQQGRKTPHLKAYVHIRHV